MPEIFTTPEELRAYAANLKTTGKTLGFVPTMGALHEGHLTLVRRALSVCDHCIVSIFVNPKQFAPHEDFERYPRTLEKDTALLESAGAHAIFAPSTEIMYPSGFQTTVTVGDVSKPLEGEFRPHFFAGVATVVTRLLLLVGADKAFFGEKDYQQLQVIKALQHDLALPTEIIGVPTVREASGLALSSRNAYLSEDNRRKALLLYHTLQLMAQRITAGVSLDMIERDAADDLLRGGFEKVDYMSVRDADTLLEPTSATQSLRILGAAWIGGTRLIDNIPA